jgi:hypothetical protein
LALFFLAVFFFFDVFFFLVALATRGFYTPSFSLRRLAAAIRMLGGGGFNVMLFRLPALTVTGSVVLGARGGPAGEPTALRLVDRDPEWRAGAGIAAFSVDGSAAVGRATTVAAWRPRNDHREDPLDANDSASEHPELVERLASQLDAWRKWARANELPTDAEAAEGLDAAELERLRSLGYVQ